MGFRHFVTVLNSLGTHTLTRSVTALNPFRLGLNLTCLFGMAWLLCAQSESADENPLHRNPFGDSFNPGVVYIGVPDIHTSWQELPNPAEDPFHSPPLIAQCSTAS